MGIYDREYYQADEIQPLRPWDGKSMVTMIIIVNVAVHIANFVLTSQTNDITYLLALDSDALTSPTKLWNLLTYGFAHQPGIRHILFNLFSLYILGRSVEERIGKWEFFRFYMIVLIACGIVWSLTNSNSTLIGASGATTAVSMLFVFYYPQATLMLYMAIPVKAWVLGVIIIVSNLFQPTTLTPEGSKIAYDVHLVGAALAAAYFFGNLNFGALGNLFSGFKSRARIKRSGLKVHQPDAPTAPSKDELESDRILEKIHREGESSLTAKERKFMEKYSRKVREKRGD